MNYFDEKNTQRLFIRKLENPDINNLIKIFSNPDAVRYISSRGITDSKDKAEEFVRRQINRYNKNLFGQFALILKDTNEFVGTCGLLSQKIDNIDEIKIAYRILPLHRNKGYATDASKKFIDFAFENNLTESVPSEIDKRNTASQKVAVKNRMKFEKETIFSDLNVFIYRITNSDWKYLNSEK